MLTGDNVFDVKWIADGVFGQLAVFVALVGAISNLSANKVSDAGQPYPLAVRARALRAMKMRSTTSIC